MSEIGERLFAFLGLLRECLGGSQLKFSTLFQPACAAQSNNETTPTVQLVVGSRRGLAQQRQRQNRTTPSQWLLSVT